MASYLKSFMIFVSFTVVSVASAQSQQKPIVVDEPELRLPADELTVEVDNISTQSVSKEVEPIETRSIPDHLAERKSPEVARLEQIELRLKTLRELDKKLSEDLLTTTEPKPSLYQARVEVNTEVKSLKKEQNEILSELYKGASSEERKVRNKLQKQHDAVIKRSNREADAARTAHLRCPVEFDGKTIVNPDANSGMRHIDRTVYLTIHSPMDGEIFDVHTTNGKWIVTSFCPGGDATISISRDWLYNGAKQVKLTAKSRSGRLAYSPAYTIYPNYGYDFYTQKDQSIDWLPFPSRPSKGRGGVNTGVGGTDGSTGGWTPPWYVTGFMNGLEN
ncbi:MAG: hypothetical protein WAX44_01800 [Minisyncoccia bacterium]